MTTSPADITAAAVAGFDRCREPRLRELMQAVAVRPVPYTIPDDGRSERCSLRPGATLGVLRTST